MKCLLVQPGPEKKMKRRAGRKKKTTAAAGIETMHGGGAVLV